MKNVMLQAMQARSISAAMEVFIKATTTAGTPRLTEMQMRVAFMTGAEVTLHMMNNINKQIHGGQITDAAVAGVLKGWMNEFHEFRRSELTKAGLGELLEGFNIGESPRPDGNA